MDFLQIIYARIKPELNQLYWEDLRPDLLYCREHAFHIYILCRALGIECVIQGGNFAVFENGIKRQHTDTRRDGSQTPDGHYWNCIGESWPVDTSLSLLASRPFNKNIGLVCETDCGGEFEIIRTTDILQYDSMGSNLKINQAVCYYKHLDLELDPLELLSNPYSFLFKPEHPLTANHGAEIFTEITLHLVKLATGKTAPLFPKKLQFDNALNIIKKKQKNARKTLTDMIINCQPEP